MISSFICCRTDEVGSLDLRSSRALYIYIYFVMYIYFPIYMSLYCDGVEQMVYGAMLLSE